MTPQELIDLWNKSSDSDGSPRHQILFADNYLNGWEEEDDGEWSQDHKYQHCERIVKHTESGRCFSVTASRSGSYHTDWYYSYDSLTEVVAVKETIVVTKWVPV